MRTSSLMVLVVGATMGGALLTACEGDDESAGACPPGSQQGCLCGNGDQGIQTCAPDGSGWGSCVCGSGGSGGSGGTGGVGGSGGSGGDEGGSGGSGMPSSVHEIPLTAPACDSGDPTVRFIEAVEDWDDIDDPAYRIFCVHPGDYSAAGSIAVHASGDSGAPRWIRYYDPNNPSDDRHPVVRGDDEQAVVEGIRILDADYWVVQGLTVRGDWITSQLGTGSEHNVLDRMLIESCRVQFQHAAHHNTLQNSVVRNAPLVPETDRVCVIVSGHNDGDPAEVHGTRIVNNEIYDCTDSVQLYRPSGSTHPIDFGGTIIDENDFYLTDAVYSDCNGNLDPQGDCACMENAVDVKAAGTGPDNMVVVSNNRMWGYKDTDTACGGSGSWGPAVVVHITAQYSLYQGNRIWDCARGLSVVSPQNSIIDNVIYQIDNPFADEGYGLVLHGGSSEAYRNVIVQSRDWLAMQGDDHDVRCNVLIETGDARGTPGAGVTADYNFYYDAEQLALPGDHDIVEAAGATAQHEDLCFWAKRWTGPEWMCLPHGAPTAASPHADGCDPNLGSRTGVGVNDELW